MVMNVEGMRRARWLAAAALTAGILSALTVVLALAAPRRSALYGAINLSERSTLNSGDTSMAVSPDGERVVVVWAEAIGDLNYNGSVWLRWNSKSAESAWSPRVSVFTGAKYKTCDYGSTSVAVADTTAHVAYVAADSCGVGFPTQSVISYTTCSLTEGGSCEAAQTITSTPFSITGYELRKVDIALDDGGNPHIVYERHVYGGGITGTIYYRGGVSQPEERVLASTIGTDPAIAWSNGYAHVVWKEVKQGGEEFEIMYSRRDASGVWTHPSTPPTNYKGTRPYYPRNPDVAAYGEHVVVTWDWQWTSAADQYLLAYTRYLTGTDQWMPAHEVGTQGAVGTLVDEDWLLPPVYTYTSTPDPLSFFRGYLEPSVTLDKDGLPTIVWHANNGTYDIMYSRAQSITKSIEGADIFSWSEPVVLHPSTAGDSASPVVAQAPVVSPTLHVVYLHRASDDWETYYENREAGHVPGDYVYRTFLPIVPRNWAGPD